MALCDACMNVLNSSLKRPWHVDQNGCRYFTATTPHIDLDLVKQAAENGCYVCKTLNNYYSYRPFEKPVESSARLTALRGQNTWYRLAFAVEKTFKGNPDGAVKRSFTIQQDDVDAAALGRACSQSMFTGDRVHLQLAQHWLSKCLKTHRRCVRNDKPQWYPTRLLQINLDTVRLLKTAEQTVSDPCATISYRWGTEPFECLTIENSGVYEAGLATSDLLPGFRDSIQIVRQLGINYIWIDSICIVQSSAAGGPDVILDKLADIASMDKVYSNSILNLAGVHCNGPQESPFVNRLPLDSPCRQFMWREGDDGPSRTYCIRSIYQSIHPDARRLEFGFQPLGARAWVMQERLLSPRMLYFSESMLWWECVELEATELCPEGMPERKIEATVASASGELFDLGQYAFENGDVWRRIVESCSRKSLTFPVQDKLLALSAIAAKAAEKFQDRYVAGCFRRDILYSMCWKRSNVGAYNRGTSFYGKSWRHSTTLELPSWSWITLEGPVEYPPHLSRCKSEALASFSDVQVDLKDQRNPFGAINSAVLSLRGRLFQVSISIDAGTKRSVGLDLQIAGVKRYATAEVIFWSMEYFQSVRDQLLFLPLFWAVEYRQNNSVFCSVSEALKTTHNRKDLLERHKIHGLLLIRRLDGTFERVGFLEEISANLIFKWAEQADELVLLA